MVAGTIIGASIFVQPSEIARHLSTPTAIMLVWLACGVLTLFGALVCAELASAFPQTGGLYVFLRDTFSPLAGFLWGWAMLWSMHTGIIAAIALVFARYTAYFVPVGDTGIRIIAVLVIVALSALNYIGVRAGSRVQTALTAAKILAIAVIIVFVLLVSSLSGLHSSAGSDSRALAPTGLSEFLLAMVAGLFAYGGWHMVTYTAGETVMPARTIPTALVWGVAIVTTCYLAMNLLYLRCTSARVGADVDADRGGRRRCRRGARRIRRHGRSRDDVVARRPHRHRADRAARVLLDGKRRPGACRGSGSCTRSITRRRARSSRKPSWRASSRRPVSIASS